MQKLKKQSWLFLIFLTVTTVALADKVILKNGGELEGVVVEETSGWIRLKTRFGTQKIQRSKIKKIEAGKTREQEFAERKKKLELDDLDGHVQLALWCTQQKMTREAKEAWEIVLLLDPQHETANRQLGRTRYEGRWYGSRELEQAKEAEWKKKGYVKFEGKWVPKEDAAKLERGLRKHEGRWRTEAEIKKAEGFVKEGDRWVRPEEKLAIGAREEVEDALGITPITHFTKNFMFISLLSEEQTVDLGEKAEATVRFVFDFFEGNPDAKPWPGVGRFYLFDNVNNFEDFVTYIAPKHIKNDKFLKFLQKNQEDGRASGLSARTEDNLPFSADYDRKNAPWDNIIYHKVSGFCHTQFVRRKVPSWLSEGFDAFVEFQFSDASRVHSTTNTSYGDRADLADKASDSKAWKELLKDAVLDKSDVHFLEIKAKPLNQLDYMDLSKSWSLVTYWVETNKEGFVTFNRMLRSMDQDDAIVRGLGKSHDELDKDWRAYVEQNY